MYFLHSQQIVFIFLTFIQYSYAFWWSLSLPSFQTINQSSNQKQFCLSLTFLTIEQRLYCQTNPKIFAIINRSLRLAIDECQYQFRNQRWNCSLFNQLDSYGKLILRSKFKYIFI